MTVWGPFGAAPVTPWLPTQISVCKGWYGPRGFSPTGYWNDVVTTIGNSAANGQVTPLAGLTNGGSPRRDTVPLVGAWTARLDAISDFFACASTIAAWVGTGDAWRFTGAILPTFIGGPSTDPILTSYNNACVFIDVGGYIWMALKDNLDGTFMIQLGQYDGAVKGVQVGPFVLGTGPILVDGGYDAANLFLYAECGALNYTATPVACGAIALKNGALRFGVGYGPGGSKKIGGFLPEFVLNGGVLTAGEETKLRQFIRDDMSVSQPGKQIVAGVGNVWGNTRPASGIPLQPDYSPMAGLTLDSDSPYIDAQWWQNAATVDPGYGVGGILLGGLGDVAPSIPVAQPVAATATVNYRTGPIRVPGGTPAGLSSDASRIRPIFVVGSGRTGTVGTSLVEVWVRSQAITSPRAQPASRSILLDGFGGAALLSDGYVATGGVLSMSAPNIALRAACQARILAAGLGANDLIWEGRGLNDLNAGVLPADYQVSLTAFYDETRVTAPLTPILIQSITKYAAHEAGNAPAFRAAALAVATAKGAPYVEGGDIYALDQLPDGVHPYWTLTRQFVDVMRPALVAACPNRGRVYYHHDSEIDGSNSPTQIWTAGPDGLPTLIRQMWASA